MLLTMFKAKIHRATVTEANLNYMGSITIDQELLEAAGILPHERVQVVNVNNGARLETYVIQGERGSGMVCLNGAAARLVQPGDVVIIIAYALLTPEEAGAFQPTIVLVDSQNHITEIMRQEKQRTVI
ncbi:MAG: aspartate 1-decarboxylase [Bacillota bacterium]